MTVGDLLIFTEGRPYPIVKTISVVMSPPKMGFSDGSVSPPQPHVVLVTLIVK